MKGLLWVLSLFALAVGVSLAAHFNEGYLLLVSPPYRVEISLSLAILLVLGSFLMFYVLLRTILLTSALPQRVRKFRERRQREQMDEMLNDAIRLLFEGRYSQSMEKAEKLYTAGQSPALAALLVARSAQRLGEFAKQKEWLEHALQADSGMQSASLMLEAEMHVDRRDFEAALAVLRRLKEISVSNDAVLRLELVAQQGCGNQEEILRLTQLLEKHAVQSPTS